MSQGDAFAFCLEFAGVAVCQRSHVHFITAFGVGLLRVQVTDAAIGDAGEQRCAAGEAVLHLHADLGEGLRAKGDQRQVADAKNIDAHRHRPESIPCLDDRFPRISPVEQDVRKDSHETGQVGQCQEGLSVILRRAGGGDRRLGRHPGLTAFDPSGVSWILSDSLRMARQDCLRHFCALFSHLLKGMRILPIHIGIDVRRRTLQEESQPAQFRLHLPAHGTDPIGRDQQVVRSKHRAVAGIVDQVSPSLLSIRS